MCILYIYDYNMLSSAILGAFVIFYIIKNKNILYSLKSLFTIGFIGGFSISLLKLSNLSSKYSIKMLLVIYIAYFSFYIGYFLCRHKKDNIIKSKYNFLSSKQCIIDRIIIIIMIVSLVSLFIEAYILKYIPILSIGTPHAYSEFHVFMIHYFTTSFILIPSISALTIYRYYKKDKYTGYISFLIALSGILFSICMSIVLVSRFQLVFSISQFVFAIIYLYVNDKKKYKDSKKIIICSICIFLFIVVVYIVITIARSHSIKYLNDIFDMKNKNTPIFITQPYMYISQNFENLNYMINNLPFFSYGRRSLTPLFSLTLIKKFFPHVAVAAPLLVKDELTTNTLIYDFYYDFSYIGVVVGLYLIGYLMSSLEKYVYSNKNNILTILIYTQMSFYMLFSFFQTFFSLPQTYVYIILSIMLYLLYIYFYNKYHKDGMKNES